MDTQWTTVIKPKASLLSVDFGELWQYRDLYRMFVKRGGRTYHIGYVIGDRWLTLYEVTPFRREVQVPEPAS